MLCFTRLLWVVLQGKLCTLKEPLELFLKVPPRRETTNFSLWDAGKNTPNALSGLVMHI